MRALPRAHEEPTMPPSVRRPPPYIFFLWSFVMLGDARNGFTTTDVPTDVGVRSRWSECQGGASVAVFDLLHTSFGSSARRGAIGPGPEGSGSY